MNGQVSSERGETTLPPAARSDAAAIVAEAVAHGRDALDERHITAFEADLRATLGFTIPHSRQTGGGGGI